MYLVLDAMFVIKLGRCPPIMQRKLKIMKYWCKLLKVENYILKSYYEYLRLDAENRVSSCMNWARDVKRELFSLGLGELNVPLFLTVYKSRIWDIKIKECHSFFENSSKCFLYNINNDFGIIQPYLRKPIQNNIRKHI